MSSPTTGPEGPRSTAAYAPYVIPPVAAGASIIPLFSGFMVKSAQQQYKPMPRVSFIEGLAAGFRAAPTIGSIIGAQLIIQDLVEKRMFTPPQQGELPTLSSMVRSSAIVGALSAPGLAIFNGQSMGKSAIQSLRGLSLLQIAAIVSRETTFLLSMRISDPASDYMKERFGDSPAVVYGSAFASGAFGSFISQPADTALTCWQNGMRVTNLSHAMRGGPVKALTVGTFAVLYKFTKETFSTLFT